MRRRGAAMGSGDITPVGRRCETRSSSLRGSVRRCRSTFYSGAIFIKAFDVQK
jgi:hypothetical protein